MTLHALINCNLYVVCVRHRERYWKTHFPWAVQNAYRARNMMTVYFEKHWELRIEQLRSELNIGSPPYTPLRKRFDR